MALNIRNPEAERLAADLAAVTGETKTEAVIKALQQRLASVESRKRKGLRWGRLDEIALHCASLPVLDNRTPKEMRTTNSDCPGDRACPPPS